MTSYSRHTTKLGNKNHIFTVYYAKKVKPPSYSYNMATNRNETCYYTLPAPKSQIVINVLRKWSTLCYNDIVCCKHSECGAWICCLYADAYEMKQSFAKESDMAVYLQGAAVYLDTINDDHNILDESPFSMRNFYVDCLFTVNVDSVRNAVECDYEVCGICYEVVASELSCIDTTA